MTRVDRRDAYSCAVLAAVLAATTSLVASSGETSPRVPRTLAAQLAGCWQTPGVGSLTFSSAGAGLRVRQTGYGANTRQRSTLARAYPGDPKVYFDAPIRTIHHVVVFTARVDGGALEIGYWSQDQNRLHSHRGGHPFVMREAWRATRCP